MGVALLWATLDLLGLWQVPLYTVCTHLGAPDWSAGQHSTSVAADQVSWPLVLLIWWSQDPSPAGWQEPDHAMSPWPSSSGFKPFTCRPSQPLVTPSLLCSCLTFLLCRYTFPYLVLMLTRPSQPLVTPSLLCSCLTPPTLSFMRMPYLPTENQELHHTCSAATVMGAGKFSAAALMQAVMGPAVWRATTVAQLPADFIAWFSDDCTTHRQ